MRLAWAACRESAGQSAFAPWRDVCDQLEIDLGDRPADDAPELARWQRFVDVAEALRRVASVRPLLVVIDDVQWADPLTLHLLTHLAPVLRTTSAIVLATVRSPRSLGDAATDALLAETERHATVLRLAGLRAEELEVLVRELTGSAYPPSLTAQLHGVTGGNPLFAGEIVRRLHAGGSLNALAGGGHIPVPPTARGPRPAVGGARRAGAPAGGRGRGHRARVPRRSARGRRGTRPQRGARGLGRRREGPGRDPGHGRALYVQPPAAAQRPQGRPGGGRAAPASRADCRGAGVGRQARPRRRRGGSVLPFPERRSDRRQRQGGPVHEAGRCPGHGVVRLRAGRRALCACPGGSGVGLGLGRSRGAAAGPRSGAPGGRRRDRCAGGPVHRRGPGAT